MSVTKNAKRAIRAHQEATGCTYTQALNELAKKGEIVKEDAGNGETRWRLAKTITEDGS